MDDVEPRYWLWVAQPDRCLDRTGRDLPSVAPGMQVRGRHWWACDRLTRAGDRAVLCVDHEGATVTYLIDITSDARKPRPWERSPRLFVCDYVVRDRFVDGAVGGIPATVDRY